MKMTKELNNKNGITLIALIITIIIMLILVSVTISMAINGDLFEKAGEAVGDTKNELNKEQELANGRIQIDGKWYNSIDDYLAGKTQMISYDETAKDDDGYLTANAKYESDGKTAVVPKGFKVVPGIENTTSVVDGLVIQDKDGNEFVWLPVTFDVAEESEKDTNGLYPEFLAVFYRSAWDDNARTSTLTSTSFPSSSYDTWSDYTEPYASGYTTPTTESADYYEMMRSVQENKGFYIGRYEAGSSVPRTNKENKTTQMVVKRDAYPYNYVGWGLTMSNYTDDVTFDGKNQGKGAFYLSKHMYDGKDIGAISTLCYGIQWDAMLDFIKDSSHNVTSSKDWGNYKDNLWTISRTDAKFSTDKGETWTQIPEKGKTKTSSSSILLTTGASDSFVAKNIYDIAGNVYEWTNEATSSADRVYRGGHLRQRWWRVSCLVSLPQQSVRLCQHHRVPSNTLHKKQLVVFYVNVGLNAIAMQ